MYQHWARMELDQRDWTKAAEAAERGLKKSDGSKELVFLAGYARSRLGQDMMARLQQASAGDEFRRSLQWLERAIAIPGSGSSQDRDMNKQIYRALVINCAWLQETRKMEEIFNVWFQEHPDDPNVQSEWDTLAAKFGLSRYTSL